MALSGRMNIDSLDPNSVGARQATIVAADQLNHLILPAHSSEAGQMLGMHRYSPPTLTTYLVNGPRPADELGSNVNAQQLDSTWQAMRQIKLKFQRRLYDSDT